MSTDSRPSDSGDQLVPAILEDAPDSVEIARAMISAFGGPVAFAQAAKAVFDSGPEGGNVRAAIVRTTFNLVEEATRVADNRPNDLDRLSDEQLAEEKWPLLVNIITANSPKWLPELRRLVESLEGRA